MLINACNPSPFTGSSGNLSLLACFSSKIRFCFSSNCLSFSLFSSASRSSSSCFNLLLSSIAILSSSSRARSSSKAASNSSFWLAMRERSSSCLSFLAFIASIKDFFSSKICNKDPKRVSGLIIPLTAPKRANSPSTRANTWKWGYRCTANCLASAAPSRVFLMAGQKTKCSLTKLLTFSFDKQDKAPSESAISVECKQIKTKREVELASKAAFLKVPPKMMGCKSPNSFANCCATVKRGRLGARKTFVHNQEKMEPRKNTPATQMANTLMFFCRFCCRRM
mmetsp:Transcript_19872/g.31154  ORF Transcript_19872/g.31154 Transcript_19872/m.31154 type:complete len:281 (-) Transcript_19872:247-1089(-)